MIYITAVHMEGGREHEHIARVKWRNSQNSNTDETSRQEMVTFIGKGNPVQVTHGGRTANVGIYREIYLRTHADNTWTDNLLALPRF